MAGEPLPTVWNSDLVGERLIKAFTTLDLLPRSRGHHALGGHWPRTVVEWAELLEQAKLDENESEPPRSNMHRCPAPVEITHMEIAFAWLRELRVEDSGMAIVTTLWALRRARGRSIKKLCAEKKWAPHTFFRKRAKALSNLAASLNARGVSVF